MTTDILNSKTQVLFLHGKILSSRSNKLKNQLEELDKNKYKRTIIDVSKVAYMDSYSLGLIIAFHKKSEKSDRKVILFNECTDEDLFMNHLIYTTGINKVIPMKHSYK